MASRRRIRRRSCEHKNQYTQIEAGNRSFCLRKRGVIVHPYHCKFGNHWHIGHRPVRITRAIEQSISYRHRHL